MNLSAKWGSNNKIMKGIGLRGKASEEHRRHIGIAFVEIDRKDT